jgi:stage IV sporulation protein B
LKNKLIIIFSILLILCVTLLLLPSAIKIDNIPDQIYLNKNESELIDVNLPIKVKISSNDMETLKFNGTTLSEVKYYSLNDPINIETMNDQQKQIDIDIELLGLLPIKKVNVSVDQRRKIIPGGQSIGVALYTKGALIVGTSEIKINDNQSRNPAKEAGLLPGDIIIRINDEKIANANDLSTKVNQKNSHQVSVGILRDQKRLEIDVEAAKDNNDNRYKLGVWVRDSTAGVGTLTFIDPSNSTYGGLGHAITDIDTGQVLSIEKGEILQSQILEIIKAENGKPGELKGYFGPENEKIGTITLNTRCGIFGEIYDIRQFEQQNEAVYVGHKQDVKLGAAYILATIDDSGINKYSCDIIDISNQIGGETKSFVIKITDNDLMESTGGIVQGMSGSPIIQDGKLIGAVTHVFVNDPSKGYGIYLDSMMEKTY